MVMRKCYSVNRSPIDENNCTVSKSWIVLHHKIVAKLTSGAEDLSFIVWLNILPRKFPQQISAKVAKAVGKLFAWAGHVLRMTGPYNLET